jgi:hypothetical protein
MFENYRKTLPALFVSWSCETFVAPLMTALLLVSVPVASALAQTPQPPSNVTVLFDYSRDHRVEFSDGDDFLP